MKRKSKIVRTSVKTGKSVETTALLAVRGKTHGDFTDHARYTQQIKDVMRRAEEERIERRQRRLTYIERESIEMIAHKIGRILAGEPGFADHWDDIAGYAKLVSERVVDNTASS